jgi:hypothetical protein
MAPNPKVQAPAGFHANPSELAPLPSLDEQSDEQSCECPDHLDQDSRDLASFFGTVVWLHTAGLSGS